jgi:ATP-dependent helicase YprA (DUF1998 family)
MATNVPEEAFNCDTNAHYKIYNTPTGFDHVREILRTRQPFEPHDWQIEGVCSALDGLDLLVTTATGTGKTGVFIMLMLVIRAISEDPSLALGDRKFPKDPAMLVVCPTKALEEDMVCLFSCSCNCEN